MAGSFIRVTLRDGSSQTVVVPPDASPEGLIELLTKGQPWPAGGSWVEATDQIVAVELFERP